MPLQPHIRSPSGSKAKGDIKVAIPSSWNCCVDRPKASCEWMQTCYWEKKTSFFGSGHCGGSCTQYDGCICPKPNEGEGHFDLNETMKKAIFNSSEDTVSEFKDYE